MTKKSDILAEKRTKLAEKRTKLAYERTVMSDVRTSTTLILFGIAFLGFSEVTGDLFFIAGWISVLSGTIVMFFAAKSAFEHSREIKETLRLFERLLRLKKTRRRKKYTYRTK